VCTYSVGQEIVRNGAPVAADDLATTARNVTVRIPVLGNDTDPDGNALRVGAVTSPAQGTVIINGDGTVSYTPSRGFTGVDRFTYSVDDAHGATDDALVTVNVTKR
jgi:hypothetical protein